MSIEPEGQYYRRPVSQWSRLEFVSRNNSHSFEHDFDLTWLYTVTEQQWRDWMKVWMFRSHQKTQTIHFFGGVLSKTWIKFWLTYYHGETSKISLSLSHCKDSGSYHLQSLFIFAYEYFSFPLCEEHKAVEKQTVTDRRVTEQEKDSSKIIHVASVVKL